MPFIVQLDAELVVVDKPHGLLSVPGRGPERTDCAWARVRKFAGNALVVHRLDMATSGLLLFARGAALQRAFSIAFAQREVHKRYEALVEGGPDAAAGDGGEIALPLSVDWPNRPRQHVDFVRGKPSLTRWRVLERDGARTRLLLEPVTGRSHQLRVHLAAMGWPIVGDRLYDDPARAARAPRLMLHASELALRHPIDGRPLRWDSAVPF